MNSPQHKIGSGFGAHSTADDVLAGRDLTGTTAMVTGGYSGIGGETTRALVRAGAHVVVPARRPAQAREALAGLPGVEVDAMDLADPQSVRAFAARFVATGRPLDMLIHSAGVMEYPRRHLDSGWEAHFAINHLGHFVLANQLRPALVRRGALVVAVSSAGHFLSDIRWDDPHFTTDPYDGRTAYGQSKTANALFALHLDRLAADAGVRAYSVHPGSILTPLQRHIPHEVQVARGWLTGNDDGRPAGFKTPAQGAATSVWAATAPELASYGGAYCQDCDLAEPAAHDDMLVGGVKPWALDRDAAARLWAMSARLTGVDAFTRSAEDVA